jgi:preprotein translocase SecE subunit
MSDLRENLEDRLDDDRPRASSVQKGAASASFFTVYRPRQGGWTRLGTAIGSAAFILGTAMFIAYDVGPSAGWNDAARWKHSPTPWVTIAWVAVSSLLAWWLLNKPRDVDFLIETDSEMKKVNWTSRKELIGSTKIVIAFMFVMSIMLFLVDMVFQYFFHLIHVLQFSPFQSTGGK